MKDEGAARKQSDKEATARLKDHLLPQLQASPDERAKACQAALKRRPWKLDQVQEQIARGPAGPADSPLASMEPPELTRIQEAAESLRAAARRVADLAGTDAGRALQTAELLETALQLHDAHAAEDCPVCGTPAVLTPSWRERTEAEVQRLRHLTSEARDAREALQRTLREARALEGPDLAPLLEEAAAEQVRLWRAGFPGTDETLVAHLDERAEAYVRALQEAIASARAEQDRRESEWRALSAQLAAWLELARAAEAAAGEVELLAQAEKWLKEAQAELRDQRFEPIGDAARQNWEELRCDSNVDLGEVRLTGAAKDNMRRVALGVTVDGVGGAALSVMSQGELNALALSLFLPRATLPESPFRFLLIDDPVQAMDPARVDGLARVLERTARTRQLLVFTHDNRLPESVRRLGIPAEIEEVTRRPRSRVELRRVLDPARRCLEDAFALAKTEDLEPRVAASVVPGFCREAVEAVLTDQVRRKRLARGERHADVEELLEQCTTLRRLAALALCDDSSRVTEANALIARQGAAEIFRLLNQGAHQGLDGDLLTFVRRTEDLVQALGRG